MKQERGEWAELEAGKEGQKSRLRKVFWKKSWVWLLSYGTSGLQEEVHNPFYVLKKPWFSVYADFLGASIPTMAYFKLLMWCHRSCGVGKRCARHILTSWCWPDPAHHCMGLPGKNQTGSLLSVGHLYRPRNSKHGLQRPGHFSSRKNPPGSQTCKSRKCIFQKGILSNTFRWGHREYWRRKTHPEGKAKVTGSGMGAWPMITV